MGEVSIFHSLIPFINALDFAFWDLPGYALSNQIPHPLPSYPSCMVRSPVESILIGSGLIGVQEMRVMMENCSGLKRLEIGLCGIQLDRDSSQYIDESCTFSLEQHGATLETLDVSCSAINAFPISRQVCLSKFGYPSIVDFSADLRWLNLPSLSALRTLKLRKLRLCEGSLSHLASLTRLASLTLNSVEIEDGAIESFFCHCLNCALWMFPVVKSLRPRDVARAVARAVFWIGSLPIWAFWIFQEPKFFELQLEVRRKKCYRTPPGRR